MTGSGTQGRLQLAAFIGLWLLADREGRLEDRPKRIKAELFPYRAMDVARLSHDLYTAGFVLKYSSNGLNYIQVTNFLKHQHPHPREADSVIPSPEPCNYTARQDLGVVEPGGSGDLGLGDLCLGDLGSGDGKQARPPETDGQKRAERETLIPAPILTQVARHTRPQSYTPNLVGKHQLRCPSDTWSACARGLCVPAFLADQWRAQFGGDGVQVSAFVDGVLAVLPDGPVGDDPLKFWRSAWQSRHGTSVDAPRAVGKGELTRQSMNRVITRRLAEGKNV